MGEKFGGIAIWDALGNHHSGVKPEDVEDENHKSASSTNTAEVLSKRDIKPIKQEEDDDEEDGDDQPDLWDLKAIIGIGTDGTVEEVETGGCLGSYAHGLACSSAYFNPMETRS
ncbi:hypothetical protein H4Q26_010621 [Puccinia striiformis f. sp. tritici PST-130]|nr:hypothetical protein H4Q26_010621 [Puccinia striiformis f. sp. tritici PST-130]